MNLRKRRIVHSEQPETVQKKRKTTTKHKDVKSIIATGNANFKAKLYQFAMQNYSEAISLSPDNDLCYVYRAECLIKMHDYRAAFEDYRLLLMRASQLHKMNYEMINCCIIVGDVLYAERAIQLMDKLVSKKNKRLIEYRQQLNKLKTYIANATAYFNEEKIAVAFFHVESALKISSESLKLKLFKAECLVLLGFIEDANLIAQSCKNADPLNSDAAYVLALCTCNENLEQGMKSLKEVLMFDPDHEKAKSMLKRFKQFKEKEKSGNDLLQLEEYREASEHFTEALGIHGISSGAKEYVHWLRARANSGARRNRDAINDCSIALGSVCSKKVLKLRAMCYKNVRDFQNCVNDYDQLYRLESSINNLNLLNNARAQLARFQSDDPYDVLDIERNATQTDIKRAFRKLVMIHHPDKHPDASNAEKHEQGEIFKKINHALQELANPPMQ